MTLEMGKPLVESEAEIVYAAEFFRWFSGETLRVQGVTEWPATRPAACSSCASPWAPAR